MMVCWWPNEMQIVLLSHGTNRLPKPHASEIAPRSNLICTMRSIRDEPFISVLDTTEQELLCLRLLVDDSCPDDTGGPSNPFLLLISFVVHTAKSHRCDSSGAGGHCGCGACLRNWPILQPWIPTQTLPAKKSNSGWGSVPDRVCAIAR